MAATSSTYELVDQTVHKFDSRQRAGYTNDDDPSCSETPLSKHNATEYSEASSSSEVLKGLYQKRRSHLRASLVGCLLLAVIIFQLVIVWKAIWLSGKDTALTNSSRLLYTTGVTVLASLISAVAINQIKTMWLVHTLQRDTHTTHQIRQARLLLEIGETQDWLRGYWLALLLMVFSLITAAITGSTAIAVVERAYSGSGEVFLATSASTYTNNCYNFTSAPMNTSVLTWEVSSPTIKSYITPIQYNYDLGCPSDIYQALSRSQAIFGRAYAAHSELGNVCHHNLGGDLLCSALGAPLQAEPYCNIFRPFSCDQGISNSACVPVFHSSPVSCRAGGSITTEDGKISAVEGANCSAASVVKKLNDHDIVSYCPTKDAVGDMSFVLGTNDGTSSDLLRSLLSMDAGSSSSNNTSIECTISMNSTMQLVRVRNTTRTDSAVDATYAAIEGTSETCDSELALNMSQIVNNQARLAAAIFVYQIFDESSFAIALSQSTALESSSSDSGSRVPPAKVFNASANSLEDYLGVQVGSAMSYYFGQTSGFGSAATYERQYTRYADRVGPGTPIAVLYVLPALCALVALIWLGWAQPHKHAR